MLIAAFRGIGLIVKARMVASALGELLTIKIACFTEDTLMALVCVASVAMIVKS